LALVSYAEFGELANHDMDSGAPFAALLVGQPTLRHRLRLGALAALDPADLGARYAVAGMDPAETADYITHHLKIAERTDTLFSADAMTLIHNASRGYPRALYNLAVNALTAAFAVRQQVPHGGETRVSDRCSGSRWSAGRWWSVWMRWVMTVSRVSQEAQQDNLETSVVKD